MTRTVDAATEVVILRHRFPSVLKALSLEELMAIEVTSVSRRAEQLSETGSAIQVVTGDDGAAGYARDRHRIPRRPAGAEGD